MTKLCCQASVQHAHKNNASTNFMPQHINFDPFEKDIKKVVSKNLTFFRKALGFTQSGMAKKLNLSFAQYRKYEAGLDIPRLDFGTRWALEIGLPMYYLLNGSGYEKLFPAHYLTHSMQLIYSKANTLSDQGFSRLTQGLIAFLCINDFTCDYIPPGMNRNNYQKALHELESREYYSKISENIKTFRLSFGLSQEYMAELIGISISTYQTVEKPSTCPRGSMIYATRFMLSTGVNPSALIQGLAVCLIRNIQDARLKLFRKMIKLVDKKQLPMVCDVANGMFEALSKDPMASIHQIQQ